MTLTAPPTSRFATSVIFLVALAACTDDAARPYASSAPTLSAKSAVNAVANARMHGMRREELRELARRAPGFAGVYFDAQHRLTIAAATDDFTPESIAAVLAWARVASANVSTASSPQIRRVTTDYLTLSNAEDSVRTAIEPADGFSGIGIDVSRNLVLVELSNIDRASSLRERLSARGIPNSLVEIERGSPAIGETTLLQKYRPAVGGLKIQTPDNPGPSTCTLGFNVYKGDPTFGPDPSQGKFFFTASHCSAERGVLTGNLYYQDSTTSGRRVGLEYDVALARTSPCPPAESPCQDADVLVVKYDDSVSTLYARVADVDGSKNITGYFNVQGSTVSGAIQGDPVTKVGIATGKTSGTVTLDCTDKPLFDARTGQNIWVICYSQANYAASEGDSGAPVFVPFSSQDPNSPRFAGIHSSHDDAGFHYFSPVNQIDFAFNSAYYHY
jgi:hypothetical protein